MNFLCYFCGDRSKSIRQCVIGVRFAGNTHCPLCVRRFQACAPCSEKLYNFVHFETMCENCTITEAVYPDGGFDHIRQHADIYRFCKFCIDLTQLGLPKFCRCIKERHRIFHNKGVLYRGLHENKK